MTFLSQLDVSFCSTHVPVLCQRLPPENLHKSVQLTRDPAGHPVVQAGIEARRRQVLRIGAGVWRLDRQVIDALASGAGAIPRRADNQYICLCQKGQPRAVLIVENVH